MHTIRRLTAALLALIVVASQLAKAQERGAPALDQMIRGLTNTGRVLMVGAHPDDEDTQLITWLTRGRQVETAYLSLTRGDGGQNLIGNELGESLGAIRTEELLAARRVDGGRQFFTRAYDFGFSKTAEETYKHWDHDSLLGDVVTVIRAFRPHVIVAVFSGTPADGHGHHQVSALLAREAYEAAADTVRFPVGKFGQAWIPLKFYRGARGNRVAGAIGMNVGEYDAVLGRSYSEIASASRSQHRSQGFGVLQRKGAQMDYVLRLATRVNASSPAADETSMFDGIDTSFARLASTEPKGFRSSEQHVRLAAVGAAVDSVQGALNLRRPRSVVPWLAKIAEVAQLYRFGVPACAHAGGGFTGATCTQQQLDLDASLDIFRRRSADALFAAAGIAVEVLADSELVAFGDSMAVNVNIYNRGKDTVTFVDAYLTGARIQEQVPVTILPDSAMHFTRYVHGLVDTRPWWVGNRKGDMFTGRRSPMDGVSRVAAETGNSAVPGVSIAEDVRRESDATVVLGIAGVVIRTSVGSIIHRFADPVLGEQQRPVGGVPPVTIEFDQQLEWIPTTKPIDRLLRVTVKSFANAPVTLALKAITPTGIRVDSLPPSLTLQPHEQREFFLRLRGSLKPGRYEFGIYGETLDGARYAEGFREIVYAHIRPIRMYHSSALYLQAVDITVPANLSVAYVQGVGDVVASYLRQLGIPVAILSPSEIGVTDLTRFSTIVVGTRAYGANRELVAYNSRLFDFAKKGGTLIVQYGQNEMMRPGVMPYPIQLNRPTAARVTEEDAPVTILDQKSKVLNWPNRIGDSDWANWVQERAVYMPSIIDPHYATPLEMHDPREPDNKGAVLITPLGKGTYIYTTLSLFRQIPGGVPGGPRLFVNLLSAGLDERIAPKVQP